MAPIDDTTRRPTASPREAALRIVTELTNAGFAALFAGGCVRDHLLGIEPDDYDVATDARPDDVQRIFRSVQCVGEAFGVMLVRMLGHTVEVATFRTDGVYSDARHPDAVEFTDARHDAERRDFTINGLFEDPLAGRVIDYVGGQADLRSRVIRAIGQPEHRFAEDHLRMLRAVRFAARFGFTIEGDTAAAIDTLADNLQGISRERIGQELRMMLSHPNRAVAAWELQYLKLDAPVLHEPHSTLAPTRVARLPDRCDYATVLAGWMLDRHAGGTLDAAATIERWTNALVLSNHDREALTATLTAYSALAEDWPAMGVAGQKRLAATEPFHQALLLVRATDRQAFVDFRRQVTELERTGLAPAPLIGGEDLIQAGLEPGPSFRRILDAVYDAQLEGTVADRAAAIVLARIVAEGGSRRPDGQNAG